MGGGGKSVYLSCNRLNCGGFYDECVRGVTMSVIEEGTNEYVLVQYY